MGMMECSDLDTGWVVCHAVNRPDGGESTHGKFELVGKLGRRFRASKEGTISTY